MKKFLIGTMIMGLASLTYSQNSNGDQAEIKLSDVEIGLNLAYLDEVQNGIQSNRVISLERKASRFNVKESIFFGGPYGLSQVKFARKKGNILATYDPKGNILYTYERYNNIVLPRLIVNKVYSEYPDWIILNNTYSVAYDYKKGVRKMYKIQVEKDGLKKKLKFDSEGNPM